MPSYSNALPPSAIWPGDFAQVWNAEQPAPGSGGASASQRVALGMKEGGPGGFSVTGFFSGAPGSFEIDVQVSDVDADAQYQTCANGNLTTVDAWTRTRNIRPARTEISPRWMRRTRRSTSMVRPCWRHLCACCCAAAPMG